MSTQGYPDSETYVSSTDGPWKYPEHWLTAIVDSSDSAILGESFDGIIISWNRSATEIFGYTAEEVIGQPIFLLVWPGEEQKIHEVLDVVREGKRIDHLETSRRHKDGRPIFVSLSVFPVRNEQGDIIGIAETARDISTKREAGEHAAQSRAEILAERRFRELIEHAPDAILEVNAAGKILIANKTTEALFGYSQFELVGCPVEILIPEGRRAKHSEHRASFIRAGRSRPMGLGLELNARRKDGSEFPVEISLSPIQSDDDTLVIAVIRDITERRRSEQQVQLLQEGYLSELTARHHEAERLNRLKSEFMASVSHELRTPLHTIIGFSDLLREEIEQGLTEKQVKFLDNIQRDSEHLLSLINDVLDLSRIEAGGMSIHLQGLSVREVLGEIIGNFRAYADTGSLNLDAECEEMLQVMADPLRLRQILSNLISNAIKFTPAGGHISVSALRDVGYVRFSVVDTGIGIAPEEQGQIFDKFYQVGVTTGGVREGTGLGLAICKQLVEMQGGTIEVQSRLSEGSCFSFTLPAI